MTHNLVYGVIIITIIIIFCFWGQDGYELKEKIGRLNDEGAINVKKLV